MVKSRFKKEKKKTENELKMGESGVRNRSRCLWYPKKLCCKKKTSKPAKNNDAIEPDNTSANPVPDNNHSDYNPNPYSSQSLYSMDGPDDSTSALVEAIIPLFLPIVCRVASQNLVKEGFILKNEVPVTSLDDLTPEKDLPIGPIEISIGNVFVVDRKTMKTDLARGPDFEWPEKERLDSLMQNIPGKGRKMLVLDFVDVEGSLQLGEGVELTFPSNIPLVGNLEVGSGGDIKNGWVMIGIKRLRIFFSSETRKCYVVFMARPTLTPFLQVSADRGNGDYLAIDIKEEGALDNIVESVLAGFGPRKIMEEKGGESDDGEEKEFQTISDKIGIAIGKFISNIIQKSIPSLGYTNSPIVLDLSKQICAAIDMALGRPRSVEQVKAHIELLQKELEMAIRAEVENAVDAETDGGDDGEDGTASKAEVKKAAADEVDDDKNGTAIHDEVNMKKCTDIKTATVTFDEVKTTDTGRAVRNTQRSDKRDALASSTVCRTGSMKGMEYA